MLDYITGNRRLTRFPRHQTLRQSDHDAVAPRATISVTRFAQVVWWFPGPSSSLHS